MLLVCSLGASLYTGEAILNVWFSLPSVRAAMASRARATAARKLGLGFDTRTRLDVAADLRNTGIDAYSIAHPLALLERDADGRLTSTLTTGTEVLPLGGISDKVSILCNESGDFVLYRSDEHGFHNPPGLWKKERIDVLAVGDSFVHGYCVPSDKNFVAVIRHRYPATLNLGMGGDGPLMMLATLREYGRVVRPTVVLWFYYEGNDLRDLETERVSLLLMRYLDADFRQGLVNQQAVIDGALIAYQEGQGNISLTSRRLKEVADVFAKPRELLDRTGPIIKLTRLRQQLGLASGGGEYHEPGEARASPRTAARMPLFEEILGKAKESVSAWGGRLYFVYLPHWRRYARPQDAEPNRDRVLRTARALGLPVIDIHEVFMAQPDPLASFPFRLNGHYNETGHRLVAEAVLKTLGLTIPPSLLLRADQVIE